MGDKVIITAALSGTGTFKKQNPALPYEPQEFAEESLRCYNAGAAMVHIHAREASTGASTSELAKVKAVYDAIREKVPQIIIQISSSVGTPCQIGPFNNPMEARQLILEGIRLQMEARIGPIKALKPESASLNTNTMNFSSIDRKTGAIKSDGVFANSFTMLQEFGKIMEEIGCRWEAEIYDIGGLDNWFLIAKQGFFTKPYNFNFVWGVAGGQKFRPDVFATLVHNLPEGSNFTACGIGIEQFPAIMQSCLMGGNMRVGLEDNIRMPNGELAKGSYEQVEVAVKIASCLGRQPATPDEARQIMGVKSRSK